MLKEARQELNNLLSSAQLPETVQDAPDKIVQAMSNWFDAYKAMESSDTDFAKIWQDHRMLLRSIGAQDSNYPSLQVKPLNAQSWADNGWAAAADDIAQINIPGVRYNTGRDGILKRADPANFLAPKKTGEIKKKYAEGLLDVSGTVMRNDKPISAQLHVKPKVNDWVCFTPLSEEADQELLLFMKDKLSQLQILIGKGDPNLNRVINKYKAICAEVTRISLAFETDMALGFVAIPNQDGTHSKYKYMVKSSVKYSMNNPDDKLKSKKVKISDDLVTLLRNNVKRYKSVVGIAIKNEVRIAIRKHANPMWPMIAKWDGSAWQIHTKATGSGEWVGSNSTISDTLS